MQKVVISVGSNPKTEEMVRGFFREECPEAIVEFTNVLPMTNLYKLRRMPK